MWCGQIDVFINLVGIDSAKESQVVQFESRIWELAMQDVIWKWLLEQRRLNYDLLQSENALSAIRTLLYFRALEFAKQVANSNEEFAWIIQRDAFDLEIYII